MNNFEKIKEIVRKIPAGKVTTYGTVAKLAGLNDARQVGWAIWGNQDKTVPCHRIVSKEGNLAERFSLGGWQEQKARLIADGIEFSEEKRVDMQKYYWDGIE